MGLRSAIARRYAGVNPPLIMLFKQPLGLTFPGQGCPFPVTPLRDATPSGNTLELTICYSLRSYEIAPPLVRDMTMSTLLPEESRSGRASEDLLCLARVSLDAYQEPATPEILDFTLEATSLQECANVKEELVSLPFPEIVSLSLLFAEYAEVTSNLLKQIEKPTVNGKFYANAQAPTDDLFAAVKKAKHRAETGERKAYSEEKLPTRGTRTHFATIWDLILPLLQPPLDFRFPSQLDFPSSLYPFQETGVRELVENKSFLLGDEMGTGKTVMSVVAMRILFHQGHIKQALVVCPAGVVPVWDKHLYEWAGGAITCTVVRGNLESREKDWKYPAHVYVVSYDTLRNDALTPGGPLANEESKKRFDLIVADEAHHIRNPGAGRARAVTRFSPTYRWALSGTPLQNSIEDLGAIFRFVKPHHFPARPVSSGEARRLLKPYFLRRMKKDVMPELPEKMRQPIWLELDPEQRAAYDLALEAGREEFNSGRKELTRIHIFALISHLKQICNFAPGKETSPKVERLLDQIEEIAEEHKAVVFSQYLVEGLDKLTPHLERFGVVVVKGATSAAQRQKAIMTFQEDNSVRVFLGATKATGEGITLTAADYVFHFDHWWNPAVAWQAEDRVHRKGQKAQKVNVYSYWMQGTYEERILAILERKGLLHEEIINAMSVEDIEHSVSMEEWCDVLGLKVKPREKQVRETTPEPLDVLLSHVCEKLSNIAPEAFERLVCEVFARIGYRNARVTGRSYDGGIDIEGSIFTVGGPERIIIQCKRKPMVGVAAARELLGTLANNPKASQGYLVVSGAVSTECREVINANGRLKCIEGVSLAKQILEFGIQI